MWIRWKQVNYERELWKWMRSDLESKLVIFSYDFPKYNVIHYTFKFTSKNIQKPNLNTSQTFSWLY